MCVWVCKCNIPLAVRHPGGVRIGLKCKHLISDTFNVFLKVPSWLQRKKQQQSDSIVHIPPHYPRPQAPQWTGSLGTRLPPHSTNCKRVLVQSMTIVLHVAVPNLLLDEDMNRAYSPWMSRGHTHFYSLILLLLANCSYSHCHLDCVLSFVYLVRVYEFVCVWVYVQMHVCTCIYMCVHALLTL